MGSMSLIRVEALLRFLALCMLLLASILMATNSQTKTFFQVVTKRATFKISDALIMAVYAYSIGAAYSLTQLVRCLSFTKYHGHQFTWRNHLLQWASFLFDQMAVYIIFAANCAATEFATLEIFGAEDLQWTKACDKYARFCFQVGWSLAFGLFGFIFLAVILGISSLNLFRWYSPKSLGKLKQMGVVLSIASPSAETTPPPSRDLHT